MHSNLMRVSSMGCCSTMATHVPATCPNFAFYLQRKLANSEILVQREYDSQTAKISGIAIDSQPAVKRTFPLFCVGVDVGLSS